MTPPLRPVREDDHGALAALRADAALRHQLMAGPPERDPDVPGWLARRAADGAFWAVADAGGGCAGYAQLAGLHRRNRCAWFGLCLAPAARGAGLGRAALRALLAEAAALGLRKLLCEVRVDNAPARGLYAAEGFREVGVLRAHYDDGAAWRDVALLERLLRAADA